MSLNQLQVF